MFESSVYIKYTENLQKLIFNQHCKKCIVPADYADYYLLNAGKSITMIL